MNTASKLSIVVIGVPSSHPTAAVEKALSLKGLPFRRVDRIPVMHKAQQAALYGKSTVPAVRLNGRRLAGSMEIFRELDRLRPDPPLLFDLETEERTRWAERELQDRARRLIWHGLSRSPALMRGYARDSKMLLPTSVAMVFARPVIAAEVLIHRARLSTVRDDLSRLASALDQADTVIGASEDPVARPDGAVLTIASSVALLNTMDDLQGHLANRPSAAVARSLFPDVPGSLPVGLLIGA